MKKLLIILTLTVFIIFEASSQGVLKENVPIVKSNCSESSAEFLQNLANRIRRNGYTYSADRLEAIAKGGFGSGFIYTDPDSNKSYIITNRHVVAQTSSVALEFIHADEEIKFENCTVLAIDEEFDLALIEFPQNHKFKIGKGLTIIEERKEEGTDIFSAGFPGLNGSPSWQLSKGIISNSSVKNDIFSGTGKFGAIQHTAAIDPGSSGGPLTVKDGNTYNVIGINTWEVSDRDNAYFAISGEAIKQFLFKYINKTYNSDSDLERRTKNFLTTLDEDYIKATQYISDEYAVTMSTNNFFEIAINVPDSVETQMKKRFNSGYPIDAVRIGLAYFLHKKQNKNEVKFIRIKPSDNPNEKIVVLSSKEKEFDTHWIYALGEWRLKDYTVLKLKNLEENGVLDRLKYDKTIKLGYESGKNAEDMIYDTYILEYDAFFNTYWSTGYRLAYINLKYNATPEGGTDVDSSNMILINYKFGAQLPIKLGSLYLVPNAGIDAGITLGNEDGIFNYAFGGGVDATFRISSSKYLMLGASYKNQTLTNHKPFNVFQLHIGIAY